MYYILIMTCLYPFSFLRFSTFELFMFACKHDEKYTDIIKNL